MVRSQEVLYGPFSDELANIDDQEGLGDLFEH